MNDKSKIRAVMRMFLFPEFEELSERVDMLNREIIKLNIEVAKLQNYDFDLDNKIDDIIIRLPHILRQHQYGMYKNFLRDK